MRMDHESSLTPRWIVFGTALVYFALGSVLTAHFMHLKEAWADSHHVFQLEIYHAVPGKVPDPGRALSQRFQVAGQTRSRGSRVLGTRGCKVHPGKPGVRQYIRVSRGPCQPGRGQNPLDAVTKSIGKSGEPPIATVTGRASIPREFDGRIKFETGQIAQLDPNRPVLWSVSDAARIASSAVGAPT